MVESSAVPVTDDTQAHLIIEVDGNDMDVLMKEMEAIGELLSQYDIGEIYFADDAQQKAELWKAAPQSGRSGKSWMVILLKKIP